MDVIGNVKDEFVKPPNYSGPVMVGHLMFDADFESGNLGRIEYSADNEYDLFIRVDTCNQKYRLWVRLNFILDCEGTKDFSLKWVVPSRWSYGPNPALGSIETMTIERRIPLYRNSHVRKSVEINQKSFISQFPIAVKIKLSFFIFAISGEITSLNHGKIKK